MSNLWSQIQSEREHAFSPQGSMPSTNFGNALKGGLEGLLCWTLETSDFVDIKLGLVSFVVLSFMF